MLEAIAREQQQVGRHAVTVHWGSWHCGAALTSEATSAGLATSAGNDADERCEGFLHFPADEALQLAGRLLQAEGPPVAVVTSDDWKTSTAGDNCSVPPLLEELATAEAPKAAGLISGNLNLVERLRSAVPDVRREVMVSHFIDALVRVTNQSRNRIDCDERLSRFGLDSLMAVELKDSIESALSISVPIEVLLEDPSIFDLADCVLALWEESEAASTVAAQADVPAYMEFPPLQTLGDSVGSRPRT